MDIGGWRRRILRRWLSADISEEGLEDGYRWMEEQKAYNMDFGGWRRIRLRRWISADGREEGLEEGYRRLEVKKA